VNDYLKVPPGEPVPVSVLALDLPEPAGGWLVELERRGIEVTVDDLGRRSVPRDVARTLIAEHAAAEDRKREVMQRNEAAAVEADRAFRAALPQGIPWHRLPSLDVLPVQAMTAAAAAEQPRRTPTQNEWLFGEVDDLMVYHELPAEDAAS
jgi:hypothetical protein